MASKVTSPEQFFGFQLGSDRKIARWDKIVDYFWQLQKESDRIKVIDMGPSTEGNPFILAIVSSAANIARLEHYRQVNQQIVNPHGLSEADVRPLVAEGKVIICQSMSLHATEIGGTQMAPELTWDLLSGDDEDTKRILDNVIFLMVPCFNPDGQIMVTDWYNRWVGTEYEGSQYPRLYQKYTGHDNNRDALTMNMIESQYMASILFRDWRPQAYLDHHHQGSESARINIPPYSNPMHPNGDPLVWQEMNWYGAHMAFLLEQAGLDGVLHSSRYEGWGHLGFHWITIYHNIAGMLTESASAKLATPLYIHPSQLIGADPRTMPEYEPQVNFPNPWPGGWWHLRGIVERQKVTAYALLDIAARCKDQVLWNAYLKATRQTERGRQGKPQAYVIPAEQHDVLTAGKLIKALLAQAIEIKVAREPLHIGNTTYGAGAHVILMDQPKSGLVKTLLGKTRYPDNHWTHSGDGTPMVRDATADTIAEFMGVQVVPVDEPLGGQLATVDQAPQPAPAVKGGPGGMVFDGRLNDSYRVANRLMAKGVKVWRVPAPVKTGFGELPPGAFYLEPGAADEGLLQALSVETGVGFMALAAAPAEKTPVAPKRVGIFQRYWAGNMDEGWTRWVLEQFEFPYLTVMDADIRAGALKDKLDVLVLPTDKREMMLGPLDFASKDARTAGQIKRFGNCPPEFRSGFGAEGAKAIAEFVAQGGRVVAMDEAYKLVAEACGLNLRNAVESAGPKRYLTKGATLWTCVDTGNPLAYGQPAKTLIQSWDSPVFEITETFMPEDYEAVVTFPERELLQSGWLLGEELIAGKQALVRVKHGRGDVVFIGFRCQNRGQTHGTFKFLFNALM